MTRALLLTASLLALAGCATARPIHGGGGGMPAPPGTCPQGGGYNDGCAAAIQTANFQNATLFTANPVSGQGPYAVRPPWNVAGADYPVGYDTTVLNTSAETAQNKPSYLQTLYPTWCKFTAASSTGPATVVCNGLKTASPLNISGIDFGDDGCTYLNIFGFSGDINITNSRFANGWGCNSQAVQISFYGNGPNLSLMNSEIDGREAWNIAGNISGCVQSGASVTGCVLTISSMNGAFDIGDMFDAPGTTGIYHVFINSVASGTPCSVIPPAPAKPMNCGVGSYNVGFALPYVGGNGASIAAGSLTTVSMPLTTPGNPANAINGIQYGQIVTDANGVIPTSPVTTVANVTGTSIILSQAATGPTTGDLITITAPVQNLSFTNGRVSNITIVSPNVFSGLQMILDYSHTGNVTAQYNYIHDTPNRPISGTANGALSWLYNYCTNMIADASYATTHGECYNAVNYKGTNTVISGPWQVSFNTYVTSTDVVGLYEAWIYVGNPNLTFPSITVDHNSLLGNCMSVSGSLHCSYQGQNPNGGQNGNGLFGMVRNTYQSVWLYQNYVDPTGYFRCMINQPVVTTFRGNISDGTLPYASAGAGTDFEITSNNITMAVGNTVGDITIPSTGTSPTGLTYTTLTAAGTASTLANGSTPVPTVASIGTGTGFVVNDTLTLADGAVEKITAVSGGSPSAVTQLTPPTSAPGTGVKAVATSGAGTLMVGATYVGPLFTMSGYQVGDTVTLSNTAVETVTGVSAGSITTYTQTTPPTLASGANVQAKSTSGQGKTGSVGPLFNFTGNAVHISQKATTGATTWALYTPIGDLTGNLTVTNNVNLIDGSAWGVQAPYMIGTCNNPITTPP